MPCWYLYRCTAISPAKRNYSLLRPSSQASLHLVRPAVMICTRNRNLSKNRHKGVCNSSIRPGFSSRLFLYILPDLHLHLPLPVHKPDFCINEVYALYDVSNAHASGFLLYFIDIIPLAIIGIVQCQNSF